MSSTNSHVETILQDLGLDGSQLPQGGTGAFSGGIPEEASDSEGISGSGKLPSSNCSRSETSSTNLGASTSAVSSARKTHGGDDDDDFSGFSNRGDGDTSHFVIGDDFDDDLSEAVEAKRSLPRRGPDDFMSWGRVLDVGPSGVRVL